MILDMRRCDACDQERTPPCLQCGHVICAPCVVEWAGCPSCLIVYGIVCPVCTVDARIGARVRRCEEDPHD